MKTLCSILVIIVTMHLACAGRCLGSHLASAVQSHAAASTPPCHKAADLPSPEKPAPPDEDTACSQTSVSDSQTKTGPQHAQLQAAIPAVATSLVIVAMRRTASTPVVLLGTSPPAVSVPILRI